MGRWKSETILLRGGRLERIDLRKIFPHKRIAIVASWAEIDWKADRIRFVLEPKHFARYMEGHEWAFPGHWLIEMVAQAAGLAAKALMKRKRRYSKLCSEYSVAILQDEGQWKNRKQITAGVEHPIECIVNFNNIIIKSSGAPSFTASVTVRTGNSEATREGIVVRLARDSIHRLRRRQNTAPNNAA